MPQKTVVCSEKRRLFDAYSAAVTAYLQAHSVHLEAIEKGVGPVSQDEVESARKEKDAARQAILDHERLHGC